MKLSRNALRNLANRYRAVLKKCRLLNTFGILLLAGCCVVGRGGAVSAEPLYGQKETSKNASVTGGTVSTDQGASGAFGGYSYYYESWTWDSYSNSAIDNSVTITGGTYTSERTKAGDNIAVAGGYANRNADGNSVSISGGSFSGGGVFGGFASDPKGFADNGSASDNRVIIKGGSGEFDLIAGGYACTDDGNKPKATASNNTVTISSGITVAGKKLAVDNTEKAVAVVGGYATTEAKRNSVTISGGDYNGIVAGGIAIKKGSTASNNVVTINGGTVNGDVYGAYVYGNEAMNNIVNIEGDAKIKGDIYSIGIQMPSLAKLSGTVNITGVAGLSEASVHGYTAGSGTETASASRKYTLNITGYNGSIKNVDQFHIMRIADQSTVSIRSMNGAVYHGKDPDNIWSSLEGETQILVEGSTLTAGKIVNFAEFRLKDASLTASKVAGWENPFVTGGIGEFKDYVISAKNTDITVTDTITEYNTLNIENDASKKVILNKVKGNKNSSTCIQSGTVILHNGISTPDQGKFTINDAEGSASFTTQIAGNLSNGQEGNISASFNTKESFLTGTADKGTGTTTLAFANGARWNMTGNSTLSGLNLNGSGTVDGEGTVDLTYGRTGSATNARTLTLDTLDGDGGTFVVDTNINNDTDRIVINGEASGDHKLDVKASGGEPSQAAMNNFIVRQNGGTASFSLANPGGKVDAGLYLYELADRNMTDNPGGREWYLQRSAGGEKSPTGETVLGLSGMASAYAMYMGQLSDLRERLGEIRHGTGTDGLWVRGFTQENTLSGLGGIDFSQNFYGTSFGYDRLVEQNENNKWLFGVRGQLTKADQRIDGLHDGSGDSRSYGLAAYATWQHGDGWYADTVLSWDWYDQNLKTRMLDGTRVHGSYNTYAGGISQEFGRLFRFGEGFFIEPQLQLSWYWMKGTDFTTSNGMKVEQDDAYALTGRAGLVLGKKWDLDEGRYFQPYIKGGVNHEFAGDQKVLVNGIEFTDDLRGTRGYYGAGFDLQFARNARLYAEFEREDGQKASTPWSVSAGLRVEF